MITYDEDLDRGIRDFLNGVWMGDFSDRRSGWTMAGQIVGGFIPGTGFRDLGAAGYHSWEWREGALGDLGWGFLGVIPGARSVLRVLGSGEGVVRHTDEVLDAAETAAPKGFADGSFSVTDWTGYPEFLPKPAGPMNLLEPGSDELVSAQRLKALKNDELREAFGLRGVDMDIHEIQPVKFGGSPTDLSNKLLIPRDLHQQLVTPFWNGLARDLEPYVYRPPKPGN